MGSERGGCKDNTQQQYSSRRVRTKRPLPVRHYQPPGRTLAKRLNTGETCSPPRPLLPTSHSVGAAVRWLVLQTSPTQCTSNVLASYDLCEYRQQRVVETWMHAILRCITRPYGTCILVARTIRVPSIVLRVVCPPNGFKITTTAVRYERKTDTTSVRPPCRPSLRQTADTLIPVAVSTP